MTGAASDGFAAQGTAPCVFFSCEVKGRSKHEVT